MLNLATLTSLLLASGALAHPTPPRYNETTPEEIESQINFADGVCTVEVSRSESYPARVALKLNATIRLAA